MAKMKKVKVNAKLTEKFRTESAIRGHSLVIDQPREGGGDDAGPTPLEYMFLSLAGCFAAIARIMANQQRINLRTLDIDVEGELDVETLLGKSHESRAGFQSLKVTASLDADMSHEEKVEFMREVERRCPVSDNIMESTPISLEVMA